MNTLEEIALQVRQCTDCQLSQGRNNAVPGEGSAQAEVMFIGEGPGFHEDRLGRPFVGPAGQFLDDLLASIGLNREQVFIANMIKCRPPQNRDPLPAEMAACNKYLDRQIELINPKLIVTLGRFSLGRFFPGESITRARGKVREKEGRHIYPIMHPAAALHRQEHRSTIVNDFKGIPEILAKLDRPQPAVSPELPVVQTTGAPRNEAQEPQQLSLFTS
ncbi:MAG: uracil-DNA glycosylase [SAR202 cluster bacterium Io17-Chloro-G9]|nr:MAG: uracil-DNA glycosylase [SAR202 cluster bacterium Io17-Chloro-G9]